MDFKPLTDEDILASGAEVRLPEALTDEDIIASGAKVSIPDALTDEDILAAGAEVRLPDAAAPVEEGNWLTDLIPQLGERSAQVAGGVVQGAAGTGDALGEGREGAEFLPEMLDRPDFWDYARTPEGMAELEGQMADMGQAAPGQITPMRQIGENVGETLENTDLGYEQRTSWDEVKSDPISNIGPFIGEQFVNSVPDMAAMLVNLPAYMLGRTGEISDERAENDGREIATVDDLAVAGPAAVASSALDRFALGKSLGLGEAAVTGGKELVKQAGKAAVREAGTEALQENIEYAATNAGTEKGYDLAEAMDRGLAGAVAGAGIGGGMRGATGGVELLRQPRAPGAQPVPPQPDPDKDRINTINPDPVPVTPEDPVGTPDPLPPVEPVAPVPQPEPQPEPPVDPVAPEPAPQPVPQPEPATPVPAPAPAPEPVARDPDAIYDPSGDEVFSLNTPQLPKRTKTLGGVASLADAVSSGKEQDLFYRRPVGRDPKPLDLADENDLMEASKIASEALRAPEATRTRLREKYGYKPEDLLAAVRGFEQASKFVKGAKMYANAPFNQPGRETGMVGYSKSTPKWIKEVNEEFRRTFGIENNIAINIVGDNPALDDQLGMKRGGNTKGMMWFHPLSNQGLSMESADATPGNIETFVHELGHYLHWDMFRKLDAGGQTEMVDQYLRWMQATKNREYYRSRHGEAMLREDAKRLGKKTAKDYQERIADFGMNDGYAYNMDEFMADMIARYAATAKADQAEGLVGAIDRAFGAAAKQWRKLYNWLASKGYVTKSFRQFMDDYVQRVADKRAERAARGEPLRDVSPEEQQDFMESQPIPDREGLITSRPTPDPEPENTAVSDPDVEDADLFSDLDGQADEDFSGDILADAPNDIDRTPSGSLAPGFDAVSRTNKRSVWEQAYVDAGLSPDQGVNLPPVQRRNVLARLLEKTFGFKMQFGPGAQTIDVVNSMLDGYQNIRMMLSTLQLPLQAISLDGSVTLSLDKQNNRYLGAYDPATKTIHMPGRSNSFAHEWMHALDAFLLDKLKPGMSGRLLSQVTRQDGLDPNNPLESSFINLVHRLFFDQADLALKMMELEREAAKVIQKGPNAGQPTAAAIKAQEQLDRLNAGATRIRSIAPTAYRGDSKAYGQMTGGDAGKQYFGSVHEMMARAFEAYIGHKVKLAGGTNEFITKGDDAYLDDADARLRMTFPKTGERLEIFSAFDDLFGELRNVGTLGTGPAAAAPDTTNAYDPNRYITQAMSNKEPNVFRQVMEEIRRTSNIARGAINAGLIKSLKSGVSGVALRMGYSKDGTTLRDLLVGTQKLVGTMRGHAKTLMALNAGRGDMQMQFIAGRFMTDPGVGSDSEGAVWEEERERHNSRLAARIGDVLEQNGFGLKNRGWSGDYSYTAEDSAILQDIMWGNKPAGATPQHEAVAGELRRIIDEAFLEAKAAGLDMGYIENKGYLPRIVLADKVEEKSEKFLKAAAEVYGIKFDNDVANMDLDEILAFAAGIGLETDPLGWRDKGNPHPYRPLIAKIRKLRKQIEQGANDPNYDPTQDQDALDQVKQDLLDLMRPDYADTAASKWRERILIGDSFTYDSHGPASDFMKSRTLPDEADELLRDFYENDIPLLAFNYSAKVKARAEFQKRAGNPSGSKRLEDVMRRDGVAKAIKANPRKYNVDTQEGRMNVLRDLTDTTKDNLIEIALNEALKAGAKAGDVTAFRDIMEQFTGQRQSGRSAYYSNMMANGLYAYAMIRLLARTAFTSLAEPMSIILQTGNFKAGMVAFKDYMGELAAVLTGETDTIRERVALARAMGIMTEPFYDGVMENRLSGDFNSDRVGSGSNGMVARFMRANGLTGLTNIQRRVAMNAGFVWLSDMAVRHKDASTSEYKRKVFEAELRDLGVPQKHMSAMIDWLAQKDTPPTLTDLSTPAGKIYANVVARLVDRVITNPRKADKPIYASTPVGRVVFTLMSFLYTFFRNVHLATANRAKRNYQISRDLGSSRAGAAFDAAFGPSGVAPTFVVGFMMLGLMNFLTTTLREALFNSEQWEEKDDDRFGWLFSLAVSRSGVYGPADILINSYKGLKYERDLTSLAAGVSPAIILSDIQNMVKLFGDKNSPNTNTSERTAAKSLYNLTMAPALNLTLSSMNALGPISWGLRYGAMVSGSSATAASNFADMVAGEQQKKRGE